MEATTCPEYGTVDDSGVTDCIVSQTIEGTSLEHQHTGGGKHQLESTKVKPGFREKILSAVFLGGFIGAVGSYIGLLWIWYILFRSTYADQSINVIVIVGFVGWLIGTFAAVILIYKAARNPSP